MRFEKILILLVLVYVWIALSESKPNIKRKEPQEVLSFLRLYTLTYVDLLILHPLMEKSILSPL